MFFSLGPVPVRHYHKVNFFTCRFLRGFVHQNPKQNCPTCINFFNEKIFVPCIRNLVTRNLKSSTCYKKFDFKHTVMRKYWLDLMHHNLSGQTPTCSIPFEKGFWCCYWDRKPCKPKFTKGSFSKNFPDVQNCLSANLLLRFPRSSSRLGDLLRQNIYQVEFLPFSSSYRKNDQPSSSKNTSWTENFFSDLDTHFPPELPHRFL